MLATMLKTNPRHKRHDNTFWTSYFYFVLNVCTKQK